MQVKTPMYIWLRKEQSHQWGTEEFQPIVAIEIGTLVGGGTFNLA
jgi:hypothetical protein